MNSQRILLKVLKQGRNAFLLSFVRLIIFYVRHFILDILHQKGNMIQFPVMRQKG